MPLSYRNLISGNKIMGALGSIDKDKWKGTIKEQRINPNYVKGYESETFWESVFGGKEGKNLKADNADNVLGSKKTNIQSKFGKLFGFENKELDPYNPYTTEGAKREEFWKEPGRILFPKIDEDVNMFRNVLFPNSSAENNLVNLASEEQYEDPAMLGFEISFDVNSPLFFGNDYPTPAPAYNSIEYFLNKYGDLGEDMYLRNTLWMEFKDKIFTIFEKNLEKDFRNVKNKPYYINKISGLNNLNKKIIKYSEDKLTITLNEDVRMISWYISELYNNLVYSYKNKRYMIPENLLRFNMNIKIHDMRNFIMPNRKKDDKNKIEYNNSPKSTIMFTLRDCSFNFFNSYNFTDEITQAGYGASTPSTSQLQFEIIYKSVTRWTDLPLIGTDAGINPWKEDMFEKSIDQDYFKDLQRLKSVTGSTAKGFWNDKLGSAAQTVANAGLNYLDNLETRLREERGKFVESTLNDFRNWTTINKIEPDNVYSSEFNNRLSLKNAGKALASDLLNDLTNDTRNISNF